MIAELITKVFPAKRYYHEIDKVDAVIKDNRLFFCLREADGEEHYLPCDKYSLVGLESEVDYGVANN